MSAQDIRDKDIVDLDGCDLALFNFDGPELDSGTVAEFMFAKFADIPSLLLRTDFRRGGDQGEDPWNLMMSFYPRTRTLCLNSIEIYKEAASIGMTPMRAGQRLIEKVAEAAVKELELLTQLPPVIPGFNRASLSMAQPNARISLLREWSEGDGRTSTEESEPTPALAGGALRLGSLW